MPVRSILYCSSLLSVLLLQLLIIGQSVAAEINSVSPRSCKPGHTTQLILNGKDLNDTLKVVSNSPAASVTVKSVEPAKAVVDVVLSKEVQFGPLGLWMATSSGPLKPITIFVDDLEAVADNGNNHSIELAQAISTLCSVDGTCEASKSDFYKITVTKDQRVSFAVCAQELRSPLDAVLKIIDAKGNILYLADDGVVGPDSRFSFQFPEAGDYWLEIHDNRYAAGAYHLRVGDFPIVRHSFPLAVRGSEATKLKFAGPDESRIQELEFKLPENYFGDSINVGLRNADGKSSAWVTVLTTKHVQVVEPETKTDNKPTALVIPIGISGQLQGANELDAYLLKATKGQLIRVSSRTRSVGCPTLLQMQLFDPKNAKVAETKVADSDEWSFDYTFPEDGEYRLEVSDLLRRGGIGFGYWIDVAPAGSFSVGFKADANAPEQFAVEEELGAGGIDLQIERFGYDGAIDLAFADEVQGLQILNPQIPAKATAARVYLVANEKWKTGDLHMLRLRASATENTNITSPVTSHSLRRAKEPFVLIPSQWDHGTLLLSGVAKTDAPFALESPNPLEFARPITTHAASLTLKRIHKDFKAGVTVLVDGQPAGWSVSGKTEKDTVTATFSRADLKGEPEQISLRVFGEFQGRGRIESFSFPVQWIDPLKITMELPKPLVAGGTAIVLAKIDREGSDPQPAILKLADLPPGLTGPQPITVAADQTQMEIPIQVAADAKPGADQTLSVVATSKYKGTDFTVNSNSMPVSIVALPKRLEVFPGEIVLDGGKSRRQLIVTGYDESESPRDWTRDVKITITDPNVAQMDGSVILPKSDGETEVVVDAGGVQQKVTVKVSNFQTKPPVAFESEVLVALSKQGCNSGACHGSPSGKGGFRLSLRAFDKQLDELTLIREDFGRRVNTLDAEKSLLLLKPTMKVSHGGGKKLHKEDAAYRVLRDWIAEGAQADPAGVARCDQLKVFPDQKRVLSVSGGGQQLAVSAHFGAETVRDVTHQVAYSSSNTSVATVDQFGMVTPLSQGETVILVRFLEHIESVPLMFVEHNKDFQWKAPPANNYIDELVNAKLQQLQYLPSDTCSDSEFVRRVYLDLIGILPTVEETKAFLADTATDKRARLVDQLLDRDEYAKFWALKWGDLLKMTGKLVGDEGVYKYHRWVEQSLRDNMPYDRFASELLTASGSTLSNPPANFYRTATDMNESVETISQVFLGARLQCAKCHNHPFERWTQDNYYGLGAFFHRVQRRKTERPGEMFVYTSFSGEVTQPRTGQTMQPWLPQIGSIAGENDKDRRLKFAEWLVDAKNPYFARIEANRIWSQVFARGIVDPIDDFRDSNPPSNEPLLDALAKDFIDSGYDRKHLLRTILGSRTYQATYRTNESNQKDTSYFSHQEPRLQSAEQLLDAINLSLGLTQKFGNLPDGTMATHLPAPDLVKVDFLKVFGQPERSTVCACERTEDSNLGMAIELFNGPMIHGKLRDPKNRFRTSIAAGKTVEETIREMYLAAVSREPSEIELKAALDHCTTREDKAAAVEDVCWALFNTDEFLFQH